MRFSNDQFQLAASDLSDHLSCEHLTQLKRQVALKEIKPPMWRDPSLDVLIQRGQEHEAAYVEFLTKQGHSVVNLNGQNVDATLAAIEKGVDVIIQAKLEKAPWMGYADILIKVPGKSKFGDWSYEVQDTKLSQNTKAATILQLSLYTEILADLLGEEPEKFHVVKPGVEFPTESFRVADFSAYYRQAKKNFELVMPETTTSTYPEPVEHCGICKWWRVCDKRRHDDDHLSIVAGIRSLHIEELKSQQINTLEQFANAKKIQKPQRGNKETYLRKQSQAQIQLDGRVKDQLLYQLLPLEPGRGLNRLPVPDKGDIYFDIEGDAFYEDGGLEYILGYSYADNKGKLIYKNHWSINRVEEKKAFEAFMNFVMSRWKKFPNLYIYHFAPYEPSAIKRLARVHAIFEKEVDDLLRAERFIDLHAVFKEGLLASVERYSLKDLEKFTKYTRKVELHDASVARKSVEVALELHDFTSLPEETIKITEDYNEDDCLATHSLHQWLETIREEVGGNTPLQRPERKTGEASDNVQQLDTRSIALFKSLTKDLPEVRTSVEHKAKWLLAHQVDYFRREDKSAWWEYFRVHELEFEELLDERKAIAGLEFVEELPKAPREKNATHRYRFPPQELSIDEGDELIEVKGEKIGSVKSISLANYTIDVKKTAISKDIHPSAVHVSGRIDPGSLATSLMDLAAAVDEYGLDHAWPQHAAKDLLMKRKSQLIGDTEGAIINKGEDTVKAAIRIALDLNKSVLAIQGPPGSGKTHIGAKMIIELFKAGKKIGITAISHKVIRNLIDKVIELSKEEKLTIHFVHKVSEKSGTVPDEVVETTDSKKAIAALQQHNVIGGTAWLWADKNSNETLDYLFVDEAGQMSLSHVLAASQAAQNLILLGDPQQLEQPQKGAHPEGSDVAALTYLLDGHATMLEGNGLFLDITRRLHPNICKFTSEIFYEGKLKSLAGLDKQVIGGNTGYDGGGLYYVPVHHKGNQNKSIEEIEVVTGIVKQILKGTWTNAKSETRPLTTDDILIVAPYNAQVSALLEKLPGMRIGTVDKFQGQEAPVVIYSMTSSSHEDAPRGMSFLYSPNRLNVATSRAKSICILVATPKLLEPECKTIDQMRWANALCRFDEIAKHKTI
jgi:predicted RecB family nuclease